MLIYRWACVLWLHHENNVHMIFQRRDVVFAGQNINPSVMSIESIITAIEPLS